MRRHAVPLLLGVVVLLSAALGGVLAFLFVQVTPEPTPAIVPPTPVLVTPRGDLSEAERSTVELFANASPSVVFITKLSVRVDPFRRNAMAFPEGTGSGFVWDASGHVVTNFHVIAGADAARVTLGDASVWDAELVGAYPEKDVAVLRIRAPADQLRPLPVGTSADLQVGQHVFAIGNPFGLDHTLSSGVISGLGREIMSIGQRPIQGVIQTDAAINPGNSGGPLLDSAGRLIGMNTAIYSPSGASAGVGFAVPVDTVRRVVTQLVATGRVERAGLGVQLDEGALARRLGLRGLLVLGLVEGSGAAQAGLVPTRRDPMTGTLILGDVIVAVDAELVDDSLDLYRILDRKEVGEVVTVTVVREGQRVELSVRLGSIVD
ncbi:MAG: trypsin-like peptidase domain-containing protein [Sandaracinus sp.]|nr:trypsin-like peptidase domain-containing protein [Sandaracinus sp.]MCB9613345.1 trypsin-like peptidase domain-containing protein [Sandaracinus sp.]MCB9632168.1 trypsin-like peptidase domain-containing protein [Sandaracinus sp.]